MPPPAPTPASAPVVAPLDPTKRPRAMWDIVLTVILLILGIVAAVFGSFAGIFLVFLSDSCGSTTCNSDQMGFGITLATLGVWLPIVASVIVSIVFLVLRRRTFWVPIAGIVLAAAVWALGFALTAGAIPGFSWA